MQNNHFLSSKTSWKLEHSLYWWDPCHSAPVQNILALFTQIWVPYYCVIVRKACGLMEQQTHPHTHTPTYPAMLTNLFIFCTLVGVCRSGWSSISPLFSFMLFCTCSLLTCTVPVEANMLEPNTHQNPEISTASCPFSFKYIQAFRYIKQWTASVCYNCVWIYTLTPGQLGRMSLGSHSYWDLGLWSSADPESAAPRQLGWFSGGYCRDTKPHFNYLKYLLFEFILQHCWMHAPDWSESFY